MMAARLATLLRFSSLALMGGLAARAGAQTPVEGVTVVDGALQRAQAFLGRGQRDSATDLLGRHLSEHPNDGRAWLYLGRIYLAEAQRWHRSGHTPESSNATMLDFASTSFEPAQELLTDSGGVYRVLVAVERATLRIETAGWQGLGRWELAAEDIPLPPVLAELGRNLLTSCPKDGVLLTGSLTETAAVWGVRLLGDRDDIILIRPDMYQWDPRYRSQMAAAIGADSAADLAAALSVASAKRPVCLAPSVDSMETPGLGWHATRMVLATTAPSSAPAAQLSVFHFGRTGLTGSVWTSAARDVYDLAARRNHALCDKLFLSTDALALPAIPACSP